MSDLIKRSDAIKALRKLGHEVVVVDKVCSLGVATEFIDVIRTVPSADRPQGEWIPCSERLPEKDGFYLVTVTDGEQIAVCKMPFVESEWRGNWFDDEVIAWMPLPSAYQGE